MLARDLGGGGGAGGWGGGGMRVSALRWGPVGRTLKAGMVGDVVGEGGAGGGGGGGCEEAEADVEVVALGKDPGVAVGNVEVEE